MHALHLWFTKTICWAHPDPLLKLKWNCSYIDMKLVQWPIQWNYFMGVFWQQNRLLISLWGWKLETFSACLQEHYTLAAEDTLLFSTCTTIKYSLVPRLLSVSCCTLKNGRAWYSIWCNFMHACTQQSKYFKQGNWLITTSWNSQHSPANGHCMYRKTALAHTLYLSLTLPCFVPWSVGYVKLNTRPSHYSAWNVEDWEARILGMRLLNTHCLQSHINSTTV